jgi:hypothetical protein
MTEFKIKTQEGKEFISVERNTVLDSALSAGFRLATSRNV